MKKILKCLVLLGVLLSHPVDAFARVRQGLHARVTRRPKQQHPREQQHPRQSQGRLGRVSWYGAKFAGRKMANGERFDPLELTTASRTYRIGTRLQLACLETGKTVIVTVTDRGPVNLRLDLDISERAAQVLGILRRGTAMVNIRVLA